LRVWALELVPGGTLFNATKLAAALHAHSVPGFYTSEKWLAMNAIWVSGRGEVSIPNKTSDCCLEGTGLVAGLTIGAPFAWLTLVRSSSFSLSALFL